MVPSSPREPGHRSGPPFAWWFRRPVVIGSVAIAAVGACADFENLTVPGIATESQAICNLAHPPPTGGVAVTNGGFEEFVVACRHIDLGDGSNGGVPGYETFGYDLDNTCTTADAGSSCIEPSWASASHVDSPGGRDNAFGANAYRINNVLEAGSVSSVANSGINQGYLTLAIRVRGYNGLTADGSVIVDYYGVVLHAGPDGGIPTPQWDGSDVYDVLTNYVSAPDAGGSYDLDRPIYEDMQAYVTTNPNDAQTGVLVSKIDALLVATPFHLSHVVMTAEIVTTGKIRTLANVVIAGRIRVDEYLAALSAVSVNGTNMPFCQDSPGYSDEKASACAYADINYSGRNDGTQPCDAISMAWRYADSAKISLLAVIPPTPADVSTCAPGLSPADDHCGP